MAKVYVKIGPKFISYAVDGLPYLPGLCMHKVPHTGKSGDLFSITHQKSGLAVLSSVKEGELELTRMILGRMLWDKSADSIFNNDKYINLTLEAKAVLTNHDRSKKQEERIAKDVEGKRQPASGSRWGAKRDIITPELLIEAKTTRTSKMSISIKDLHFLTKQAYQQGKIPAYVIELGSKQEVVIVPAQELTDKVLSELGDTRTLDCKTKKSFSIGTGLVDWITSNNCALVETSKSTYALISYYFFLEVSKRGL